MYSWNVISPEILYLEIAFCDRLGEFSMYRMWKGRMVWHSDRDDFYQRFKSLDSSGPFLDEILGRAHFIFNSSSLSPLIFNLLTVLLFSHSVEELWVHTWFQRLERQIWAVISVHY